MTTRTSLKLVSFDGGGVRGLSQLEIMENIMHQLNWEKQSNGSPPSLPCEYFDLMGGSGTGGLISIMFAKLRMTVEEASKEFSTIAEEVYKQTDMVPSKRTQCLKICMEDMMNRRGLPADMKLLDGMQTGECACFVVTSPRINAGTKLCLRSYPVRNHVASSITVVEAVLATCATQPAFAPVTFGLKYKKKEYMGAGIGANNPINEVIIEAHSLYGGDATVVSLLSLGSGHPGVISMPSDGGDVDIYKAMRDMMNDCTEKAREIKQKIGRSGVYYRFSVEQGMQHDHSTQAMDLGCIVTQTESYIEEHVQQLEAFVRDNSSQLNVTTLDQLKSGNVQPMLPENLDMMNAADTGPNNEVVILAKLKPLDLECGPAVGECMEGTRLDVLTSIIDWASDFEAPNIFWVKGHPGVGKSAISVTLTEGLRNSGRLGSSFFFQRERANFLTPNALWRVTAYDLARQYPTIRKRLLVALSTNEALPTTLNTAKLFNGLIHNPLTTCDKIEINNLPIIVIDALDECGGLEGQRSEHRTSLLRTLKGWSNLPKRFKLIVTSRGEADLEELFSTTSHVPLEIHAGTSASLRSLEDIKRIFEQHFRQIVNRYQGELSADWPGHQIIQALALKSGGLFIWAKIIIGFLDQGQPEEQLRRVLAGAGAGGMATLYSWILTTAFPHPSENVIKDFHAFVGTIIFAKDPLPASSIRELCSIDPLTMKYILNGLQSVMTSRDIPRFKHQSVVDFLIDPAQCPPGFLIDQNDQNRRLTLQCLQIMKKHLQFNICEIESSSYRNSDIPDLYLRVEERISRHISYSCCFWTDHLTEICFEVGIHENICDFMENQFLFWVEVLSLIKRVNRGSSMMQSLINWLQSAGRDDKMAVDMKKFISMFGSVISQSTPHIYLSALPFSPQRSLVSGQYRKSYPRILDILCGGQSNWSSIQNVLIEHVDTVYSVAFSPDGKRIVSGSHDWKIRVCDVETGEMIFPPFIGHIGSVTSVAFSPDGNRVVSGSKDSTVRIWDAETGKIVSNPFKGHLEGITSVAFSPDGKRVVSGSKDSTIRIWDAETGEMVSDPFKGHIEGFTSVAFSPDGKRIVSGSHDWKVRVWDAETGKMISPPFIGHIGSVTSVAFSPDGNRVVSGSKDSTVRMWDVETGEMVSDPFKGHIEGITSVAFSPDGKRIVSGSKDSTIRVWGAETDEIVSSRLKGHIEGVTSVAFSSDGKRVASGSYDKTIRLWNVETNKIVSSPFQGHTDVVTSVAFSPDGKRIVSGSHDWKIQVWDAETGERISPPFIGHIGSIASVAFSPDGKRIVSGSKDSTVRMWDAETGEIVSNPFKGHIEGVTSVAFSPDGKHIASGSKDTTIRFWDVETGKTVSCPFRGHLDDVTSVAFSPNGNHIVSGSKDTTIRFWGVKTGKTVSRPFGGHFGDVTSVAFSPDGKRVVSGSKDISVRMWSAEAGELVSRPFKGHIKGVTSVAFSSDGKRVASGSYDKTILVWEVETGQVVARLFTGHADKITSVAFSPDGKRIVSGSKDQTVRLWDVKEETSCPPHFTDSSEMVDGWVLGPKSERLFWVPPELQKGLYWPRNTMVIGKLIKTKLDLRHFAYGRHWSYCRDALTD